MPILLIDDQQTMLDVMELILSRLGFEHIERAQDGATALSLLNDRRYDLVISDVQMEPIGGLALLRHVRSDARLKNTRFVLTTASMSSAFVVAAKQLNVDAYILKPFTPSQLRAKILDSLREGYERSRH